MFDANGAHEDWRLLFQAWRKAEREGREATAFDLLVDLMAARCLLRNQSDSNTLSQLDIHLLIKFGTQLEQQRKYREARSTYESAGAHLRRQRDECGSAFFSIRAVRCCVALLDLVGAGHDLGDVLAMPGEEDLLQNVPRAMQAASTLSFMSADPTRLHFVRIEALANLSEYWAACGRLGAAEEALQHTVALLNVRASKYVSAPDVLVRLGEIRLDRGDFAGVEQLITTVHASDLSPTAAAQWRVLEGQLRHLQGRFSEAKELLSAVAQDPESISTGEIVIAATRQRFHVLCALNRLDEAEVVVDELERASTASEVHSMRTLLAGRRGVAISSLGVPPATREILGAGDYGDLPPEQPGVGELDQVFSQGPRTRQRIRDEYGRIFNQVMLALHAGQHERALLLCTHLSAWASSIDSALIAARQLHLWAFVYYYCEDWKAAIENAELACSGYAKLGMPNAEWAMRDVIGWALRRSGGLVADIQRNREESTRLNEEMAARLQPEDRSMYALNKWSSIDEEVSAICHRLEREEAPITGRFSGWFTRLRVSRVTRTALREILKCRALGGIQGDNAETSNVAAGPADQEQDVYGLALRAIRRRLRATGLLTGMAWLHASWVPSDTAVLHYIVLPDRVELFVMACGWFYRIKLPRTTRAQLWEKVRATLVHLRNAEHWHGKTESIGRRVGDLGACLGFTELRFPPNIRNLVVVPDDILANVPFAALPIGNQPCISQFTLRIVPIMAWTESTVRPFNQYRSALGIAVTASTAAEPGYAPLHGITQEVRALANGPAPTWQHLEDQDAKVDRVKAKLLETDIAHFACHGEFSPTKPAKSGLLLHDRWLTIEDLDELELNHLAVVVLTSCWGGSTQTLPGNVHVGMPFALLDRGVQTVIASLWEVSHTDAIDFAQCLYRESAESGPVLGLAKAQQIWTQRKPSTWAGYTVYSAGVVPAWPWRWLLPILRRWENIL